MLGPANESRECAVHEFARSNARPVDNGQSPYCLSSFSRSVVFPVPSPSKSGDPPGVGFPRRQEVEQPGDGRDVLTDGAGGVWGSYL